MAPLAGVGLVRAALDGVVKVACEVGKLTTTRAVKRRDRCLKRVPDVWADELKVVGMFRCGQSTG